MADKFQERAIRKIRERHETQIRENAERIRDHIGYVLARLDKGRSDSVGLYAKDIGASARRIVTCVAALEAVSEVTGIYESKDGE